MFTLFTLNESLSIAYRIDRISLVFLTAVIVLWITAGIYSGYYMKGKEHLTRFYSFYGLLFFVLVCMSFAANLFTFYLNYELMTLCSVPLVMHEQTREARDAGFKYLIYSFFGAYFVLFGFYVLNKYCTDLTFTLGGTLDPSLVAGHEGIVLLAAFFMIIGFGVKAGMWPLHAWLTTAHPIAPSPASAILSGVIVKAGVVGIIRAIYYLVGVNFVKGTWVQATFTILTLMTVLMGSTLAFFEPVLKKRLAYSTISQVSYILFGLSLFEDVAFEGALLQFTAHAFAKCGLFLAAGILIIVTGSVKVGDMRGVGKKYPVLLWCYTILSLSMIGIPPTGGFLAKWYLIEGSLRSEFAAFAWVGPVFLLVSALLTAGYLLPLSMNGFMPGKDFEDNFEYVKLPKKAIVPIIVLTVLCVLAGILPNLFTGGAL